MLIIDSNRISPIIYLFIFMNPFNFNSSFYRPSQELHFVNLKTNFAFVRILGYFNLIFNIKIT